MDYSTFDLTFDKHIAHIRLNRPDKRNSMNLAFWNELPAAVRDIDNNSRARVIVISSTGPHFTAGLDIGEFFVQRDLDETEQKQWELQKPTAFYHNVKLMQDSFSALENCRLPVLAAIQGGCIGGGVDLATACDMRYCSEDAFFTIFETKIGMTADVGTFPRICNLLPEGIVRELAYTGRRMPSQEACRRGLVNEVFSDQESMLAAVMGIATDIAANAPLAVRGCKHMINYSRDHNTQDALDYVVTWNMSMLLQEQMLEAMQANGEKREGRFVENPLQAESVQAL